MDGQTNRKQYPLFMGDKYEFSTGKHGAAYISTTSTAEHLLIILPTVSKSLTCTYQFLLQFRTHIPNTFKRSYLFALSLKTIKCKRQKANFYDSLARNAIFDRSVPNCGRQIGRGRHVSTYLRCSHVGRQTRRQVASSAGRHVGRGTHDFCLFYHAIQSFLVCSAVLSSFGQTASYRIMIFELDFRIRD